jgi:predicted small secreted protein
MSNPVNTSRDATVARDLPPAKLFLATLFLFAAMTLTVSGCNTMSGLGEDVSTAGETLSGTAEDIEE